MIDYPRGNFGDIEVADGYTWSAPSSEEMARMDGLTIERGTSASVLMEKAGSEVCRVMRSCLPYARRFVVLCGPGNNGGDGLAIARLLRAAGLEARVVIAAAARYSDEFVRQLSLHGEVLILGSGEAPRVAESVSMRHVSAEEAERVLEECDVVVDALLGTGQRSAPRQHIAEAIALVDQARSRGARFQVIAVDIPTGVDADSGQLFEPHITADRTVCVEAVKRGLLQFPARGACGALEAVSIGIVGDCQSEFYALEGRNLPRLGKRRADAHKGDFGRILVVGGSLGMPGAASLTALGALRSGAGIVSRVTKRSWLSHGSLPECMVEVLSKDGDSFEAEDAGQVVELLGGFDVVVIGPGIGTSQSSGEFLARLCDGARLLGKRVVIDADAINLVSLRGISLHGLDAVVTPHPGEASRMLGRPTPALQADRFSAVRELWEKYGVVAVLKGAGTLVYGAAGGRIVCRGTPYLATAGSGDVLAGVVGALCARFDNAFDAACLGAWAHAVSGILASERSGGPILASEIAFAVSGVIGGLEE